MGVPGLWDLIRPAAVRTSLQALSRDAFLANANGLRALTIGIDASIWIFHAQTNHNGANAFLRTIFFKITALLQHPVLPVFVFDGPQKPSVKRNKRVARSFGVNDGYSRQFKDLLDVCGLEWWNAPGEAEAELALMNRQGKIDAVLSDDVDALLFGATCLLRNNSPTLSGAQASSTQNNTSRSDLRHYEMYRISDIVSEWTRDESALKNEDDCRRAMVLVALLGGGDYVPEGVGRMGPKISHGLAKAGHADFLKHYAKDRSRFDRKVAQVHADILEELKTNSSGHMGRRYKKLAEDVAEVDLFPTFSLDCYLCPATSPADDPGQGWPGFGEGEVSSGRGRARNTGRGDLEGMARACERYFEWGTREIVCKKFASDSVNLFGAEIVAEARTMAWATAPAAHSRPTLRPGESPERITSYFSQRVVSRIQGSKDMSITSSAQHLVKIHSTRPSPMCSSLKEYRLEYQTKGYADRCRDAMDGHRVDPSTLSAEEREAMGLVGEANTSADATVKDEMRIWVADYIVKAAWPHLITKYEDEEAAKAAKKAAPKKKKAAASISTSAVSKGKKKATKGAMDPVAFEEYFAHPPASQSAVREVQCVTASQVQGSRSSSITSVLSDSSDLTPAPSSPMRASSRASSLTSASEPLFLSPPSSPDSPDVIPHSLPSPPVSPSKRGRSARSVRSAASSSSSSREFSPSRAPGLQPTPVVSTSRRSPRKKRATPPRSAVLVGTLGTASDPILLSSDDDDTPRPLRFIGSVAGMNSIPTPAPESPENSPTKNPTRRMDRSAPAPGPSTVVVAAPLTSTGGGSARASRRPAVPTQTSPHSAPTRMISTASTTTQTQSRLESMIVARAHKKPASKPKPIIADKPAEFPKLKVPYFVVSEDEDGVEHIDLTQRRPRGQRT